MQSSLQPESLGSCVCHCLTQLTTVLELFIFFAFIYNVISAACAITVTSLEIFISVFESRGSRPVHISEAFPTNNLSPDIRSFLRLFNVCFPVTHQRTHSRAHAPTHSHTKRQVRNQRRTPWRKTVCVVKGQKEKHSLGTGAYERRSLIFRKRPRLKGLGSNPKPRPASV